MKKILLIFTTLFLFTFLGCTPAQPPISQEQLREITTKEIEGNYKTVFKATMAVLEDQNFLIKNAGFDTGLISCEKSAKKNATAGDIFTSIFIDSNYKTSANVIVSANITEINENKTRVRLSIQETTVTSRTSGKDEDAIFVTDRAIYDSLFNHLKIEVEKMKAMN